MQYYTTENKLTEDKSYMARVLVGKTYNDDELVDKILRKRNIISRPDLRGVISAMKETIAEIVEDGDGLNLSWLKLGYSMKGRFETADTVREPDKHPLKISLNAGAALTDALSKVAVERIKIPDFDPKIESFYDGVSKTTNEQATPGGIFKVFGERLRIDGKRPENIGLFLRAKDGTETKVEVMIDNDPGVINAQLPGTLAVGDYIVVIKTQVGSGGQSVNEVRTGISKFTLTVQ